MVVAVGVAAQLRGAALREHSVDGVLLPGFVDAGTALEHADAAALAGPGPAAASRCALDRLTAQWTGEQWARSAHRGVLRALRAGTTTVCDVVTRGPAVPAASRAGLAGTSWVEVADVDVSTADEVLEQVQATLSLPAEGRRVGVAIPSLCRVGAGVLESLATLAKRCGVPFHVGTIDAAAEAAALRSGAGPLADAAREAGRLYEGWRRRTVPSALFEALGVLTERTTIASGVCMEAGEAELLAARGVGVGSCSALRGRSAAGSTGTAGAPR